MLAIAPAIGGIGLATAQQSSVTVDVGDATVSAGETASVDVTMSSAPDGISGYNIVLGLDNDSATITNASVGDDFALERVEVMDNGSAVEIRGLDLNESVQPGASDVMLGSVEVEGVSAGSASLSVQDIRVDTESGNESYDNASVDAGTITVEGDDGEAPVVSISDVTVDEGASASAEVTMSEAPDGVAGYEVVFGVEDGSIANITGASASDEFALEEAEVMDGGDTVRVRAVDLQDNVTAGDTDISLGSIELTGESEGMTNLSVVEVIEVTDDNGDSVTPTAESGMVTVEAADDGEAPVVSISDVTVDEGASASAEVTMSEAPDGVAGYDIVFGVEDGSIANITGASASDEFALRDVEVMDGGDTVRVRAVDLQDNVTAGDTDISLGSIELTGESEGTTNLSVVEVNPATADDNGDVIEPTAESGMVTVEAVDGAERPSLDVMIEDDRIMSGDTTTANVVLSEAPEGLAGFEMTVSVDGESVDIIATEYGNEFRLASSPEYGDDGDSVTVEAVDLERNVEAGAENVTLVSLTLEGVENGSTTVAVTDVSAMENDNGNQFEVDTSSDTVDVIDLVPIVDDRLPTDPDNDGLYEDIDGNGALTYNDVVALFENLDSSAVQDYTFAYDFDGNGQVTYNDLVVLFEEI